MSDCLVEDTKPIEKSSSRCEVIPLILEKHPNADKLSIVRIGGYQAVTQTEQWAGKDRAVYCPPDSMVPIDRPEFAFLNRGKGATYERIKAKKLRGEWSEGLLVAAPPGAQIGDDVSSVLGVQRYEPPEPGVNSGGKSNLTLAGENEPEPFPVPKYDLEAWQKFGYLIPDGTPVVLTEKLHGANARFVYWNNRFYCGSRTGWKREYPCYDHLSVQGLATQMLEANERRKDKSGYEPLSEERAIAQATEVYNKVFSRVKSRNMWWAALFQDRYEGLRDLLENNPGLVAYAECYGQVQDLKYGTEQNEVRLAVFDLWDPKEGFLNYDEFRDLLDLFQAPGVPVLARIPHDRAAIQNLISGPSVASSVDQIREGIVVRPEVEIRDPRVGRLCLKAVSREYLERA